MCPLSGGLRVGINEGGTVGVTGLGALVLGIWRRRRRVGLLVAVNATGGSDPVKTVGTTGC